MTAFERYGVKKARANNYAASGGSAGRCGYIRTYNCLAPPYVDTQQRIIVDHFYYRVLCGIATTPASCINQPYAYA